MDKVEIIKMATAKIIQRNKIDYAQKVKEKREQESRTYKNGKPTTFYLKHYAEENIQEIVDMFPREKDITRSNVVEAALNLLLNELDRNKKEAESFIYSTKKA